MDLTELTAILPLPCGTMVAGYSKVAATGYSFPSGHTTWATSLFGGVGLWARRRKRLLTACVLFAMMLLTMFSRNYLGVHTPQDVLVGFAATALMMAHVSRAFARFVGQAGVVGYTMLLTPWAMSRLRIPETFDGNEESECNHRGRDAT